MQVQKAALARIASSGSIHGLALTTAVVITEIAASSRSSTPSPLQVAACQEQMQAVASVPGLFESTKPPNEIVDLAERIGMSTQHWIFRTFPCVHGENKYV